MVSMFEEKMCSYCKNSDCKKQIYIHTEKNTTIYKCNEYIKDLDKIIPYEKPLMVSAKRSYVKNFEI